MWRGASLRKEPNPADRHISRHIKIKENRVRSGLIDARLWGWIGGGRAGDKRRHSRSEQDAATECFADTDQNLLNYRLGTTSIQVDRVGTVSRRTASFDKFLGISLISSHPSEEALVTEHLR
jgi:hypothetical protein